MDCSALEILTGDTVTRSQAMEIPTVSACIAKIADTVSRLPVKLYRKDNGKITEIQDDNRLLLLNGETGDTLTTVDMWKAVIEDYFLGNGAWIYINSNGIKTKSLHYVDSRNISIMTNNDPIFRAFKVFVNGVSYYDFQFVRLFRKTRTGYSNIPLQSDNSTIFSACYNALKLENSMNGNGGNKRGFLKSKTKLSPEALDVVRKSFPAIYGNGTGGKIPVLNDGLDFEPLSSTAVELQINENKKANSTEICKLFGFPHTVIDGGATDDDNKKFTETIVSILNQIETALDSCLLLETEKNKGFYFAFDTKELTRGSLRERYEAYQIAIKNHILQVDEVRREEDYEPLGFNFVTMGLGDVLLNPKTMEVFTPNTGQTSKLGENRAEIELRYNHNHDEKGRFCSGGGGGRMSSSFSGNSTETLDNSGKSNIIEESRKNKHVQSINDVSINKVKALKGGAYSEEQNQIIQAKHKELLEFARNNNPSGECAFILSSDFNSQINCIGKTSSLDFSSREAINILNYNRELYVMHNHPKNSSFSANDIRFLMEHISVKTLSIVKHNGRIEQLTKTASYNAENAIKKLRATFSKYVISGKDSEIDRAIKEFINLKELFIYEKT